MGLGYLHRQRQAGGPAERQEIDPTSPWWGIHLARYRFATSHVEGRRVLDVACGSGYGLAVLLKARARWVAGVDLNPGAARKAQAELRGGPGQVIVADGCKLPFADESFDVITSFETLEHLEHRKRFLAEVRRVLTPDGLCILSTPNAKYTLPQNGQPRNPYHIHEYTPEELTVELGDYFSSMEILGQSLDSRFTISPFREDQQRLPRTFRVQVRLLVWRVLSKFPSKLRNRLSKTLLGHELLPGESDYQFSSITVEKAPVTVALCRGIPLAWKRAYDQTS